MTKFKTKNPDTLKRKLGRKRYKKKMDCISYILNDLKDRAYANEYCPQYDWDEEVRPHGFIIVSKLREK